MASHSVTTQTDPPYLKELDNVGIRDLLSINDALTTTNCLANLVKRFHSDVVYTSLGSNNLLIYIQPKTKLSIYSDQVKEAFSNQSCDNNAAGFNVLPPHIYQLISSSIPTTTIGSNKDSTMISSPYASTGVLFSGDSGSGKSLNFQSALQFLQFRNPGSQVMKSLGDFGFVLDLFGCTVEGGGIVRTEALKLFDIGFDWRGRVVGAGVKAFLLPSVATPVRDYCTSTSNNSSSEDEETKAILPLNYLVFHVLLSCQDSALLKSLCLVSSQFNFKGALTSRGGPSPSSLPDGRTLEEAWHSLKETLIQLTSSEEFSYVLKILAALLYLGSATFSRTTNLDGSLFYEPPDYLNKKEGVVNKLFGLEDFDLLSLLLKQENPPSLIFTLVKDVYSRLFNYLISLQKISSDSKSKTFSLLLFDYPGNDYHSQQGFSDSGRKYVNSQVQKWVNDELRKMQVLYQNAGFEWILVDTFEDKRQKTLLPETPHKEMIPLEIQILFSMSSNLLLKKLYAHPNKIPLCPNQQLKINLRNILDKLRACDKIKCVRCIRPSSGCLNVLDKSYVNYQLGCHRILDTFKVLKGCHVESMEVWRFLRRYRLLSLKTWPSYNKNPQQKSSRGQGETDAEACRTLLSDFFVPQRDFVVGSRHVFLKRPSLLNELEQYRVERLDDICVIIQKTWRGFHARKTCWQPKSAQVTFLLCHKIVEVSSCGQSPVVVVENHRSMKSSKSKQLRAALIIQRAYIQWKRLCYLTTLQYTTFPMDETSSNVPVPSYLLETHELLRVLFHKWKCRCYRMSLSPRDFQILNEKRVASDLFRGKKSAIYQKSVSHPFQGDYIRLRSSNVQFLLESSICNECILFSDLIHQIKPSSGKLVPQILLITTERILLLDPRSLDTRMTLLPRRITMSSRDDYAVIVRNRLKDFSYNDAVQEDDEEEEEEEGSSKTVSSDASSTNCLMCSEDKKGVRACGNSQVDVILLVKPHLVEVITKMHMIGLGKGERVEVEFVDNETEVSGSNAKLRVAFVRKTIRNSETSGSGGGSSSSGELCVRKKRDGNKLEIFS